MRTLSAVDGIKVAALAAVYFGTATAGLRLDAVSGFAAPVWPPTGIALAALLLLGSRVWPGVTLGALLVNLAQGASFLGASGIAVGNTLEALLGAALLRRLTTGPPNLERLRDVLALVGTAALVSTLVSATIGVTSAWRSGAIPGPLYGEAWRTWWLGDAIGDLIVAPFLLVWGTRPRVSLSLPRLAEAAALLAATVILTLGIFRGLWPGQIASYPYLLFPLLIWSAIRFGPRGAVTLTFIIAMIATWGTVRGLGSFVSGTSHENLVMLQMFLGVIAITVMVLGASVSERRQAEEALSASERELLSAHQAKDQFLAMLAHELRNPLAAISNASQILKLSGSTDPRIRQVQAIIERQLVHQSRLIEDLLEVSRIERGKIVLESVRLDLVALVQDAVEDLRSSAESAGLTVAVEAPTEPATHAERECWVEGDPTRLAQVVANLYQNAVRSTEPGGRITVRITATPDRQRTIVEVADTGIGIEEEMLSRIFEPFTQADGAQDRGGGLGLGLALVKGLVELHGGEVSAQSDGPDRGACFTFWLPTAPPPRSWSPSLDAADRKSTADPAKPASTPT